MDETDEALNSFKASECRQIKPFVSTFDFSSSSLFFGDDGLWLSDWSRYAARTFTALPKKRGEAKRTQTPAGTAVNVRPRRSGSDEEAHVLPAESEVLFASPIGPFKKD
ncbi:hypothetical protein [Domibacillus tundrae]|uniref:hypothetical protein n=1 Tax=Domibacillus tundrae TaxID=1587527 RepID=UPI0033907CE1